MNRLHHGLCDCDTRILAFLDDARSSHGKEIVEWNDASRIASAVVESVEALTLNKETLKAHEQKSMARCCRCLGLRHDGRLAKNGERIRCAAMLVVERVGY